MVVILYGGMERKIDRREGQVNVYESGDENIGPAIGAAGKGGMLWPNTAKMGQRRGAIQIHNSCRTRSYFNNLNNSMKEIKKGLHSPEKAKKHLIIRSSQSST